MKRFSYLTLLCAIVFLNTGCNTWESAESSVNTSARVIENTAATAEPVVQATVGISQPIITPELEVHFIDVGQGDSTLIISDGATMLIDAGDDSKGTLIQNYLQKRGIQKLDYLILTHPDSDHIGGAPVIITKFEIDTVFVSNYKKDNATYLKLIQALDDKRLKYSTPEVGSTYPLGGAEFTILAPNKEYSDPNNASIALLIQNGENKWLFSGDAEENAEKDILSNDIDLQADVYKVGHHGSKTSTSEDFFKAVKPTYAVISCAEGNSYGHPHAQTMNSLRMNSVKVYRTDEAGTIIAKSDGVNIIFDVPASDSWMAGEPIGSAAIKNESPDDVTEATNIDTSAANDETEVPSAQAEMTQASAVNELTYVLNSKTNKFHRLSCSSLPTVNRVDSSGSREEIIASGYVPCKKCNP